MAETGERGKIRRRLIIGGALAAAALVCLYFVDDYHPEGSKPDQDTGVSAHVVLDVDVHIPGCN